MDGRCALGMTAIKIPSLLAVILLQMIVIVFHPILSPSVLPPRDMCPNQLLCLFWHPRLDLRGEDCIA